MRWLGLVGWPGGCRSKSSLGEFSSGKSGSGLCVSPAGSPLLFVSLSPGLVLALVLGLLVGVWRELFDARLPDEDHHRDSRRRDRDEKLRRASVVCCLLQWCPVSPAAWLGWWLRLARQCLGGPSAMFGVSCRIALHASTPSPRLGFGPRLRCWLPLSPLAAQQPQHRGPLMPPALLQPHREMLRSRTCDWPRPPSFWLPPCPSALRCPVVPCAFAPHASQAVGSFGSFSLCSRASSSSDIPASLKQLPMQPCAGFKHPVLFSSFFCVFSR